MPHATTYVTLEPAPQQQQHQQQQQQRPPQPEMEQHRHRGYDVEASAADGPPVTVSGADYHQSSSPNFVSVPVPVPVSVPDTYLHFRHADGGQAYAFYGHVQDGHDESGGRDKDAADRGGGDGDADADADGQPSVETSYGKGSNFAAEKLYATVLSNSFDEAHAAVTNEQVGAATAAPTRLYNRTI